MDLQERLQKVEKAVVEAKMLFGTAKPIRGVTSEVKNGTTYWYARVDGRRVCCGKGEKGRKMAIAARGKQVAAQYENREVEAGLRVKKSKFKTVRQIIDWYMLLPQIQEQDSYDRKIYACKHLIKYFGNRSIYTVQSETLERYRAQRISAGAAHGTVNIELTYLGTMYYEAKKARKIHAEQIPTEFRMVNDKVPRRRIKDEEFEKLVESAPDEDFRDLLIAGWESAMRRGEIVNLKAYQIHLDEHRISDGEITIVDYIDLGIFDTKTGARRTVPVSKRLKEILERRLEDLVAEDNVFTYIGRDGQRKTYYPSRLNYQMRTTCERAGIVYGDKALNSKGERIGIVFHCLRHSRISKWVEMGFSDEIIRRASGNQSLEAYQQYIKLDPTVVVRLVAEKSVEKASKISANPRK